MKPELIFEVVKKLVGPIDPARATHIDKVRMENLKTMCEVMDKIGTELDRILYENKNDERISVKEMADYVDNFLTERIGITE